MMVRPMKLRRSWRSTQHDSISFVLFAVKTAGAALSKHPDVIAASVKATEDFGAGTTGSRLLNGTYSLHVALEQQIATWLGREGGHDAISRRLQQNRVCSCRPVSSPAW